MAHKYHAERRHHIPKVQYRVRNWRDDEAGLRRRGSLTIWFTQDAVEAWQAAARTTPGRPARYSALAIETSLTLRVVFDLALRQTEGLVGSILKRMGLGGFHEVMSRFKQIGRSAPAEWRGLSNPAFVVRFPMVLEHRIANDQGSFLTMARSS